MAKTQEQIKSANDTIVFLQDYIALAKLEKSLKSDFAKEKVDLIITELHGKANELVTEVL